jgi:capsular exopolysaccharide synthesis family protein
MELKQYVSTLWKWSWLIVLGTLVSAVSTYWDSSQRPPVYSTSTTLMVGQFVQSANPNAQDLRTSQQLAESYVQLVRRKPILEATTEALQLDVGWRSLVEMVSARLVAGTQLMEITVVDTDPHRAQAITDEIARQLILQSPTPGEQEQDDRRQFVGEELVDLEAKVKEAKAQIEELEDRSDLETSARGVQDIQNQIALLQQRITTWRGDYADLLTFFEGSPTNYLSVVEPAVFPQAPIGSRALTNVVLAASIGLVLAAGVVFLLEYLDDTIKTGEDVDRVLQLPILGAIARIQEIEGASDHLVTMHRPRSTIAEAYRVLRTNVQFSSLSNPSSQLLVTSASPLEGKTTTACNLGIILAQAGRRVILADTDLRRPSVHRFFGVPNQVGLTSLLLDEALPVKAALAGTSVESLRVMPSGPLPPNPAELLGSERMKARLDQMKELADVIVFDSPPVLAVADATILGALTSGVILVVDAGRTRSDMVRRAKKMLDQVGLKVLGVVLNKLTPGRGRGYYYYYYYHGDGERRRRRDSRHRRGPFGVIGRLGRRVTSHASEHRVEGKEGPGE